MPMKYPVRTIFPRRFHVWCLNSTCSTFDNPPKNSKGHSLQQFRAFCWWGWPDWASTHELRLLAKLVYKPCLASFDFRYCNRYIWCLKTETLVHLVVFLFIYIYVYADDIFPLQCHSITMFWWLIWPFCIVILYHIISSLISLFILAFSSMRPTIVQHVLSFSSILSIILQHLSRSLPAICPHCPRFPASSKHFPSVLPHFPRAESPMFHSTGTFDAPIAAFFEELETWQRQATELLDPAKVQQELRLTRDKLEDIRQFNGWILRVDFNVCFIFLLNECLMNVSSVKKWWSYGISMFFSWLFMFFPWDCYCNGF